MKARLSRQTEEVAGGRTRLPIRSLVLSDTPDALDEGLRPLTARRPLPEMLLGKKSLRRKTP
jgi:hypothetical protein